MPNAGMGPPKNAYVNPSSAILAAVDLTRPCVFMPVVNACFVVSFDIPASAFPSAAKIAAPAPPIASMLE